MTLLIISFIAGVLTVLAPCILPLLPVVIGSSASGRSRTTPYVVVVSLGISIILFTYLLKASTAFIMIPPEFWTYLSGGILVLFGLSLLFPSLWENLPGLARLSATSNKLVGAGYQRKNIWGDALVGAALGPVFSTCSPTYFVILASVLPVSFALGTLYLFSYVFGLSLILLLIAFLGQRFANRLTYLSDPRGIFKRLIGAVFIILGVLIATGYEKKLETAILDSGYFDVTKIEHILLRRVQPADQTQTDTSEQQNLPKTATTSIQSTPSPTSKVAKPPKRPGKPYREIASPAGFVNSEPITLQQYIGKKVILVDFMTYSCINCQRTFPYLNAWYEKYKDEGLLIVGIHTPEFAFEKDINNVREAMQQFGITYPVVLDNEYATWRAYGNNFWPRKYLVDIYGNIVYDHIGEGAYKETETKIRELLSERASVLGAEVSNLDVPLAASSIPQGENAAQSPETYFGSLRNINLANGTPGRVGEATFALPNLFARNFLYLGGRWNIQGEYAESVESSSVVFSYTAKEVYIVADADEPIEVEILQDGKPVGVASGDDVKEGIAIMRESRLYKIIRNQVPGNHILEMRIKAKGLRLYAFTFG